MSCEVNACQCGKPKAASDLRCAACESLWNQLSPRVVADRNRLRGRPKVKPLCANPHCDREVSKKGRRCPTCAGRLRAGKPELRQQMLDNLSKPKVKKSKSIRQEWSPVSVGGKVKFR